MHVKVCTSVKVPFDAVLSCIVKDEFPAPPIFFVVRVKAEGADDNEMVI